MLPIDESTDRFAHLHSAFSKPMTEICLLFYEAVLQTFIHFNLFLQREDPPSREQPRRQNRQEAHRREHRPRGYPEVSSFQGTPDLQELPLPRHTDVTGHVPLWPTNQRSATYPPNTTSTANTVQTSTRGRQH